MSPLQKIQNIAAASDDPARAAACRDLLKALDSSGPLELGTLYGLPYSDFDVALKAIEEWRLRRYTVATDGAQATPQPPEAA